MKKVILSLLIVSNIYGAVLEKSVQRAIENRLYEVLLKINHQHFFINNYILDYGIENPTFSNLTEAYIQVTESNRAKDINEFTLDVEFRVDFNHNVVRYSKIFATKPTEKIIEIAKNNVAMRNDSYFRLVDNNYELVIPLDYNVIVFMEKVQKINDELGSGTVAHNKGCNISSDGDLLYKPDGYGDFNIFECHGINFDNGEWSAIMDVARNHIGIRNEYNNARNNVRVFLRQNNNPSSHAKVKEYIYIDNHLKRIR